MSQKNLIYLLVGGAVLYWLYKQSQSPANVAATALNTLAVQPNTIPLTVAQLNPMTSFAQTYGA